MGTLIAPLTNPRPLSRRPLPQCEFSFQIEDRPRTGNSPLEHTENLRSREKDNSGFGDAESTSGCSSFPPLMCSSRYRRFLVSLLEGGRRGWYWYSPKRPANSIRETAGLTTLSAENISKTSPLNRRSLDYARDDRAEGGVFNASSCLWAAWPTIPLVEVKANFGFYDLPEPGICTAVHPPSEEALPRNFFASKFVGRHRQSLDRSGPDMPGWSYAPLSVQNNTPVEMLSVLMQQPVTCCVIKARPQRTHWATKHHLGSNKVLTKAMVHHCVAPGGTLCRMVPALGLASLA